MGVDLYIIYGIVLLALGIGSYTDFKVREVPDWISYGLIFTGLGLRAIFSLAYLEWSYIIEGLAGFGIFLALALVMFYAGQWGGGDAKVLMGLGALIGVQFTFNTFLVGFFVNTLIAGAIFGLVFSIVLAMKHKQAFAKKAQDLYLAKTKHKYLAWAISGVFLVMAFIIPELRISFVLFAMLSFITFYLFVFIKAIEEAAMIKQVSPKQLTEGDWIVNDIIVKGKRICGPKDLGIEKAQIEQLIKLKVKSITIKEGIPFVPSFLLGFIVTMVWGNWMFAWVLSLA